MLKRFYASPVKRINILLGIGMSRLFFQLLSVIVLIAVRAFCTELHTAAWYHYFYRNNSDDSHYAFPADGGRAYLQQHCKNRYFHSTIDKPIWFSADDAVRHIFPNRGFPKWLQSVCRVLPLTQYNDAIRKISFEGLHIYDCWKEIGILAIWMVIIYAVAVKVLKWE